MTNKNALQMISKWILFSLFYFMIPLISLEASIINPDLAPYLPGYEEFAKGRTCFNEENWEEALHFFDQAITKSHKPSFDCGNFTFTFSVDEDNYVHHQNACEKGEDWDFYAVRGLRDEIKFAVNRHSHFYFGLIRLYQGEINQAHFHFRRAIGFFKDEQKMGELFYRIINCMDPYWMFLTSLTSLQMDQFEEATKLCHLGFCMMHELNFDDRQYRAPWDNIPDPYMIDYFERINTEWEIARRILLYNTQSIVYEAMKQIDKAIKQTNEGILAIEAALRYTNFPKHLPAYAVLYSNRGMLYKEKNNYQEALLDFTKAIELNPDDPDLYFYRGDVYLIIEDYAKALDDYQQAMTLDPYHFEYDRRCALAYAMTGSLDQVKTSLYSFKKKENDLKKRGNEQGLQALSTGAYSKAIHHFNQFVETNPSLAVGYQNRGIASFQAGDLPKALDDFNEAIKLEPGNADLYQLNAITLMTLPTQSKEEETLYLTEAQHHLATALKLNPNDPKIYQNLAAVYSLQNDLDAALECYTQALLLVSGQDHLLLLKNLLLIHFKRGEYEKALLYAEKSMQLECSDGEIDFIAGLCAFETNQFEEAITHFQLASQKGYDQTALFFQRAKAYFCVHQFDQALEDATSVLQRDPLHLECYQLRGLIFLSLQRELEAYTDFSKALTIQVSHVSSQENQTSYSRLPENMKEQVFQNHHLLTSFDGRLIYKLLSQSAITQNEDSLIKKIGDIDFDIFGKGLAEGLVEGGKETLKELGPFLTHLVFHPIDTTEEILSALHFLLTKALDKDWETIGEVLVPELKELFSNWDTLEDEQKGKLVGLFIGKNGMTALTALGVCKTFSKLRNVVVGCDTKKLLRVLKRTEPKFTPLPASDISFLPTPKNKEWCLPYADGNLIEKSFVGECPLVQMAPNGLKNKALFEGRAIHQLQTMGHYPLSWETFENSVLIEQSPSLSIDFRRVSPPVIEAEIVSASSTVGKIEVVLNEEGNFVSACLLQEDEAIVQEIAKISGILIKKGNVIPHVMQKHHHWEKVIELTGDINKDFKKVVQLIKDNKIIQEANIHDILEHRTLPLKIIEYRMEINRHHIAVLMENYLETGEIFLKNAYVITTK